MARGSSLVYKGFKVVAVIGGIPLGIFEGVGRTIAYEIDDASAALQALMLPFGLKNIYRFTKLDEHTKIREFAKDVIPRYTEEDGANKKTSNGRKAIVHFLKHTALLPITLLIFNPIHRMYINSLKIYNFIVDKKVSKEFPSLLQNIEKEMETFRKVKEEIDTVETEKDVMEIARKLDIIADRLVLAFLNGLDATFMLTSKKSLDLRDSYYSAFSTLKTEFNLEKLDVGFIMMEIDLENTLRSGLKKELSKIIEERKASLSAPNELKSFEVAIQGFKQDMDVLLGQLAEASTVKSVSGINNKITLLVNTFGVELKKSSSIIGKLYSPKYKHFSEEFNVLKLSLASHFKVEDIYKFYERIYYITTEKIYMVASDELKIQIEHMKEDMKSICEQIPPVSFYLWSLFERTKNLIKSHDKCKSILMDLFVITHSETYEEFSKNYKFDKIYQEIRLSTCSEFEIEKFDDLKEKINQFLEKQGKQNESCHGVEQSR